MDPGDVMFAGTLSSVSLSPTRSTLILKVVYQALLKFALEFIDCFTYDKNTVIPCHITVHPLRP